jgi:hypothetical protein
MKLNSIFWLNIMTMAEGGEGGSNAGGDSGGNDSGSGSGGGSAGDAGAAAADWRSNLPEDIRSWQEVKDAPDAATFYKQVGDMRSRMGRSITVPGEDAGTEAREQFYQKLQKQVPGLIPTPDYGNEETAKSTLRQMGAPEDANGYERVQVDGIDIPDDRWGLLTSAAAEAGLTRGQFKKVIEKVAGAEQAGDIANHEQFRKDMDSLNLEWGLTKEGKVSAIKNLLSRTGAPAGLLESIESGTAGANTLRWLNSVLGGLNGENNNFYNQEGSGSSLMSPNDAITAISEIRNNKDHPYNNKLDPAYKAAREKVRALYKMAYPGQSG